MEDGPGSTPGNRCTTKGVKKILITIGIVVLVLILAVVLIVKISGDRLVKFAVETGGTQVLKVDVRLDSAQLQLLQGDVELSNLEIDNPEGYEHPQLLKMGNAHVDLATTSLLSDTVQIDTLQLDNIELVIEQKGLTSNLNEILANLPKGEEKEAVEKKGKDLIIKDLTINGVTVKAKVLPVSGKVDTLTLKIAPIHLTDIGTAEKVNVPELTAIILRSIAVGVAQQGKDILPTEMLGDLTAQLSEQGMKVLESGKQILEESGKGILEGGKDIQEKATEGFKGIFQRKEDNTE